MVKSLYNRANYYVKRPRKTHVSKTTYIFNSLDTKYLILIYFVTVIDEIRSPAKQFKSHDHRVLPIV